MLYTVAGGRHHSLHCWLIQDRVLHPSLKAGSGHMAMYPLMTPASLLDLAMGKAPLGVTMIEDPERTRRDLRLGILCSGCLRGLGSAERG